jgi:4-amino-4-deoxy-L-arabinose transferase-like glycosyltransferase
MKFAAEKYLLITIVLVIALVLRLYGLTVSSFWADEGFSAFNAQLPSAWIQDAHPPLYYALLSVWTSVSFSDYWIRLFSVIFGVITVLIIYLCGNDLFDRKSGIWAAVLLAVLSSHVAYSQEARMYTLFAAVYATSIWCVYRLVDRDERYGWPAYVVLCSLVAYSHALGVIYWFALGLVLFLHLVVMRKLTRKLFYIFTISNVIVALIYLPWAYSFIFIPSGMKSSGANWISSPSLSMLIEIPFYTFAFFRVPELNDILNRIGIASFVTLPNIVLSIPLVLLLSSLFITKKKLAPAGLSISICVFSLVIPIFAIFATSLLYRPILTPKSVLPTAIPLVLLLGAACSSGSRHHWLKTSLISLTLLTFCLGTFYYHRYHYLGKESWREASLYIQENVSETDCVLFFGWMSEYMLRRYDHLGTFDRSCMLNGNLFRQADGAITPQSLRASGTTVELSPGNTVWAIERLTSWNQPVRRSIKSWSKTISTKDFRMIHISRFSVPADSAPP